MYTDRKMIEAAKINNEYYQSKYFESNKNDAVKEISSLKEIEGW